MLSDAIIDDVNHVFHSLLFFKLELKGSFLRPPPPPKKKFTDGVLYKGRVSGEDVLSSLIFFTNHFLLTRTSRNAIITYEKHKGGIQKIKMEI